MDCVIDDLREKIAAADEAVKTALSVLDWAQNGKVAGFRRLQSFKTLEGEPPDTGHLLRRIEKSRQELVDASNAYLHRCETTALRRIAEYSERTRTLTATLIARGTGIYRLPLELLSEVFKHTWNDEDPFQLLQLCRVCSRWRSAALETPALWSRVMLSFTFFDKRNADFESEVLHAPPWDVSGDDRPSQRAVPLSNRSAAKIAVHGRRLCVPEHVRLWAGRARNHPLHLDIQCNEEYEVKPWTEIFTHLIPRMGSVTIKDVYLYHVRALFEHHRNPFPVLRQLTCALRMPMLVSDAISINLRMPNLTSFSYGLRGYTTLSFNWASLPELTRVSAPSDLFYALLSQQDSKNTESFCRSIRYLEILGDGDKNKGPRNVDYLRNTQYRPLVLSDVTRFFLSSAKYASPVPSSLIKRTVRMPNLASFTLDCDDAAECINAIAAVVGAIATPAHVKLTTEQLMERDVIYVRVLSPALPEVNLRELCLKNVDVPGPYLRYVFSPMPKLATLRLESMAPYEILKILTINDNDALAVGNASSTGPEELRSNEDQDEDRAHEFGYESVLLPSLRILELTNCIGDTNTMLKDIRTLLRSRSRFRPPTGEGAEDRETTLLKSGPEEPLALESVIVDSVKYLSPLREF